MLAGRRPLQADNLAELMYKHRFEEPTPIHELRPDAPKYFLDAVTRAISKDRDVRFPTMDAFLAALETPDFLSVEGDRTPPLGSQEATLRVQTPPGMRTPRPGALDATTPETPFRSPVTVPPADTTPPTVVTPPPITQPPTTPPAITTPSRPAARASRPKPEVIDPFATDKAESVTPRTREALLTGAGARQPGVPRWLMLGAAAAVVLVVGALVIFGPLRLGGGEQLAEDTSGQISEDNLGIPEGPDDGALGPGDQAAGDQTGDETPADGGQDVGGQAGGGEVDPAQDAADGADTGQPSGGEQPAGGAEALARRQAEQARERARQERRLTAGTLGVDKTTLNSLDGRLATANRDFDAKRYDRAAVAFSSLIKEFKNLRLDTTARTAERTAAEDARASAIQQQQAAINAGAETAFSVDLGRLNSRLESAENAFQASSYGEARQLFEALSSEYKGLAARATTELRSRATNARNTMESNRRSAVAAGAEGQARDRLASADGIRDGAQRLESQGRYVDAAARFGEAGQAYAKIKTDLDAAAAAAAAEDEPAGGGGDAGPAGVPAEQAIGELIEAFRRNFEQEDLNKMSSEVYKGDVPRSDADLMNTIFRSAEDLQAALRVRKLDIKESSARADIRLDVKFRQARTGESGSLDLTMRLDFVSGPDGWRMTRAAR
jgi:hypothetical protein